MTASLGMLAGVDKVFVNFGTPLASFTGLSSFVVLTRSALKIKLRYRPVRAGTSVQVSCLGGTLG